MDEIERHQEIGWTKGQSVQILPDSINLCDFRLMTLIREQIGKKPNITFKKISQNRLAHTSCNFYIGIWDEISLDLEAMVQ